MFLTTWLIAYLVLGVFNAEACVRATRKEGSKPFGGPGAYLVLVLLWLPLWLNVLIRKD